MNQSSQSIRVGLFFLFGVALLTLMYLTLTDPNIRSDDGYRVVATFKDLRELKVSDEVRMSGVRIGSVLETDLVDGKAVAVLAVRAKFPIPANSEATIQTAGIIGTNYISITYGDSEQFLASGDDIRTFETPGFAQVVSEIGRLGEQMDEAFSQLHESLSVFAGEDGQDSLFVTLNHMLSDNRERLNKTLTNLEQISDDLANSRGALGKLIQDDEAYDRLLTVAENFTEATDRANAFLQQLQSTNSALGAMVYDDQLGAKVRTSFDNIEAFTIKLNSPSNSLGRILGNDALYLQAEETLQEVDDAVKKFSGGSVGSAAGALSNGLF
ncbi:MCE family protein [Ruficoccus amylovorans]|uniref:MCE family protein n=1 Tax=Ruficoccus amylovorans TaxID=1804625 RepID=A0A842HGI3_9BACT|nr:MlaD family protein [Ruficoccus amylovorans]MBC2595805.1 MCE family protein [Ruficoccus amylovorans]